MPSENPEQVRMWSFGRAPREFQTLFEHGSDSDWVAHVPETEREAFESSLLQWRPVYPVRTAELTDQSVVYHGAPREALELIAERHTPVAAPFPMNEERRKGTRVHLVCPSQYQTPTQIGSGHTIDISCTGIAFTTEALLTTNTEVTLRMSWPVRLESGAPVELCAVGKLARTEPVKAAMQIDSMSFAIAK